MKLRDSLSSPSSQRLDSTVVPESKSTVQPHRDPTGEVKPNGTHRAGNRRAKTYIHSLQRLLMALRRHGYGRLAEQVLSAHVMVLQADDRYQGLRKAAQSSAPQSSAPRSSAIPSSAAGRSAQKPAPQSGPTEGQPETTICDPDEIKRHQRALDRMETTLLRLQRTLDAEFGAPVAKEEKDPADGNAPWLTAPCAKPGLREVVRQTVEAWFELDPEEGIGIEARAANCSKGRKLKRVPD